MFEVVIIIRLFVGLMTLIIEKKFTIFRENISNIMS